MNIIPSISPLAADVRRPFWSVMIPTYNRPGLLEQTLQSVLAQDRGVEQMQIEVVDNCSSEGNIEALVDRVGKGRVTFFRQASNLGVLGNWNTCVHRSKGKWIQILHDDDLAMPGFYAKYEQLIGQYPEAVMVIGPSIYMDARGRALTGSKAMAAQEGPVDDFSVMMATENHLTCGPTVISRTIYEQLGGYDPAFDFVADWEMYARAGAAGQVITTGLPYSAYRIHQEGYSAHLAAGGKNREEFIRLVDLLCSRLPSERQALLPRRKYRWIASNALHYADILAKKGLWSERLRQYRWAFRIDPGIRAFLRYVRAFIEYPFQHRGDATDPGAI